MTIRFNNLRWAIACVVFLHLVGTAAAEDRQPSSAQKSRDANRGDRLLAAYFRAETEKLAKRALADVKTKEDWLTRRGTLRKELFEMLSLDPLPARTPLKPVVTGSVEHDGIIVEKVQFQSMPGLYVTGNLYRPKTVSRRLPTILYVCGHGAVRKNGVSFGNKVAYQHHDAWYAQNGYVCFTIDSVQLGEIEGVHHGTYRFGMWWWNSCGFTPAGVEAWNCIRALDYLESRPEVDASRIGATGRSGGGAYSWWIAALDDRIKVAVPVAGITNLKNHVVDGCVEGHCDCMYPVNTYRWDFCTVAALVAPRPLLIGNTDRDSIFPLDGVVDLYHHVRHIYELLGARDNLGLEIAPGPHVDSQELQLGEFRWFNHYLKNDDRPINKAAAPLFTPEELRVFSALPTVQRNSKIFESFVPTAVARLPKDAADWERMKADWMTSLREKVFRGWPDTPSSLNVRKITSRAVGQGRLTVYEFRSQEHVPLRLHLLLRSDVDLANLKRLTLVLHNEKSWSTYVSGVATIAPGLLADEHPVATGAGKLTWAHDEAIVAVAPRGVGITEWSGNDRDRANIRRRFMLLGQTLDGMRVWDARRSIQALRTLGLSNSAKVTVEGTGEMATIALFAALLEPSIGICQLRDLSSSFRTGPDFLNVARFLDVSQVVAMVAERCEMGDNMADSDCWEYSRGVAKVLGWPAKRLTQSSVKPAAR